MTDSRIAGDECGRCKAPMVRKEGLFYWRGVFYPGIICESCRALWPARGEEMPPLKPPISARPAE